MEDTSFSATIQTLSLMIGNKDMVDEFVELYMKTLEDVRDDMCEVKNTMKTATGLYTARGEMLKTILHKQLEALGVDPPQQKGA